MATAVRDGDPPSTPLWQSSALTHAKHPSVPDISQSRFMYPVPLLLHPAPCCSLVGSSSPHMDGWHGYHDERQAAGGGAARESWGFTCTQEKLTETTTEELGERSTVSASLFT